MHEINPILQRFVELEKEAAQFGFKWETATQILAQVKSECVEVEEDLRTNNRVKLQEEVGDLLHAVFSLCVFCEFDIETTLENSVNKFAQRFEKVKRLTYEKQWIDLNGRSFDELMLLWDEAKNK